MQFSDTRQAHGKGLQTKDMDRLLSVVVSVYNEEKALEEFYRETTKVLGQISWDYELIFVNDGSRDGSQDTSSAMGR